MREQPVLLRVGTGAKAGGKAVMRDDEVEDKGLAASLVPQLVPNFYVTTPSARACRDSTLGADRQSSRAEERAEHGEHPIVRLGCT